MDDEEKYLHEHLVMLHESYKKAAKPFIDRLVDIESCKPISITVTTEQADRFFLNPSEAT